MVYRTAGLIDNLLGRLGDSNDGQLAAKAIAEYAIECSINKVFATEMLDHVVDEGVQIHGGYGFMQEYEIENMYRDSRINRIFEGTNEINRLLIPGTLLKKAMKGELPLLAAAGKLQEELLMFMPQEPGDEPLAAEKSLLELSKKIFLMVAGNGVQKYQKELEQEQELLSHAADIAIQIYAMESALLRTLKAIGKNGVAAEQQKINFTRVFVQEAFNRIEEWAKEALAHMEQGDTLRTMLSVLKKLTRRTPVDTIGLKREIARRLIEADGYTV